jgi:hypothetical protein
MINSFPELAVTAVIQTKTTGSGITNGSWVDGDSITGIFTQSTGTESIVNQGDAVTVNGMFHYEGSAAITERDRLYISGAAYGIIYIQNQKDLETMKTVKVISLRRLK